MTALLLMGFDKWRAIENKWRIPENVLLFLGILGGGFGLHFGSLVYRHKTRKPLFRVMIPLMMIINSFEIYYLFF
jgi:uncharacterized membrane protein YsdA (DUF1294 family)